MVRTIKKMYVKVSAPMEFLTKKKINKILTNQKKTRKIKIFRRTL